MCDLLVDTRHLRVKGVAVRELSPCLFVDMLTGCNLALSQFNAMFIKRFLNSLREKKAIITQILIPVVLVLIGCLLSISSNPQQEDPKLALQLSMLKEKSEALYGYHVDYRNTTQAEKDIFVKVNAFMEMHFLPLAQFIRKYSK